MKTNVKKLARYFFLVTLFVFSHQPYAADDDDDFLIYLPAFLAKIKNNSGPTPPPGTKPPTIQDLINYYKNYPLGSQPNWLVGQWVTSWDSYDEKFTFNADGSCSVEHVNYSAHTQISPRACKWGVKNTNQLFLYLPESPNPQFVRVAQISPLSGTSFLLTGLSAGLRGWQYNKITNNNNTNVAKYPGQYFLGTWHTYHNITNRAIWDFRANGNLFLTIYEDFNFANILASYSGSWSATPSTISLTLPGSNYSGVYNISGASYALFNTTSSLGPFSRRLTPHAQSNGNQFVGQYHGFDTTMVVSFSNGSYHVHLVEDGVSYNYNASVEQNINLVISVGNSVVRYTLQLGGYEKANSSVTITPSFPNFLSKVSTTPLANPTSMIGKWENRGLLGSSSFQFMPRGHYVSNVGTFQQVGQYQITGNTLKLNPVCESSSQIPLNITENQWMRPLGNNLSSTYLYEPLSNLNANIYEKGFVMSRTIENNQWKAQIKLGSIRSYAPFLTVNVGNSGIITVGNDFSPNDVFQGAKVFKDVEAFWWHNYLGNNLDDSVFYFYPNGRMLYVSVNYTLIPETYYDIVPRYAGNVLYLWGKYKIDDIIESNPRSAFDKKQLTLFNNTRITLLNGHRQIHFPDTGLCWENYKWLSN